MAKKNNHNDKYRHERANDLRKIASILERTDDALDVSPVYSASAYNRIRSDIHKEIAIIEWLFLLSE